RRLMAELCVAGGGTVDYGLLQRGQRGQLPFSTRCKHRVGAILIVRSREAYDRQGRAKRVSVGIGAVARFAACRSGTTGWLGRGGLDTGGEAAGCATRAD